MQTLWQDLRYGAHAKASLRLCVDFFCHSWDALFPKANSGTLEVPLQRKANLSVINT